MGVVKKKKTLLPLFVVTRKMRINQWISWFERIYEPQKVFAT